MFKVNGATVYPSEVETALRSVGGVQQAHVTNVSIDGADVVGALVITARPLVEIAAEARERLSAFKFPSRWAVTASVDDVPMLASANVDKRALQALLISDGRVRESSTLFQ
jgi:acyl-CoA synthetase (AMP-forming)/AMP-acid ligase II